MKQLISAESKLQMLNNTSARYEPERRNNLSSINPKSSDFDNQLFARVQALNIRSDCGQVHSRQEREKEFQSGGSGIGHRPIQL